MRQLILRKMQNSTTTYEERMPVEPMSCGSVEREPRRAVVEHSEMYAGMMEDAVPMPIPATKRPATKICVDFCHESTCT